MTQMGRYCKAYPIERLAEFPGWPDRLKPAPAEASAGQEPAPHDYLYLQENFTVTEGIFLDEGVVFDEVSPECIEFCRATLKFEAPSDRE